MNVSGHRIGSAEVESALVLHSSVAEAAVVGRPHSVKGEALFAYVIPTLGVEVSPDLIKDLQAQVRTSIGGFARPDDIIVTPSLPKTRSGKIMRRILRSNASHFSLSHRPLIFKLFFTEIASRQYDGFGDVSTLLDPSVVESLIAEVKKLPPIE